jgi:hypothetical protein
MTFGAIVRPWAVSKFVLRCLGVSSWQRIKCKSGQALGVFDDLYRLAAEYKCKSGQALGVLNDLYFSFHNLIS